MIQFLFPFCSQQSTSFFCGFYCFGFFKGQYFCYLCQIYGYLAFLLPPQREAHLYLINKSKSKKPTWHLWTKLFSPPATLLFHPFCYASIKNVMGKCLSRAWIHAVFISWEITIKYQNLRWRIWGARAVISSGLNFCNSVITCLSKASLDHLQLVQNAAAKLLRRSSRCSHISPLLISHPWLPNKFRNQSRVQVLTFRALHGEAPTYTGKLLQPYVTSWTLRAHHPSLPLG